MDLKSISVSSVQINRTAAMGLQSDAVFEMIKSRVIQEPGKSKSVNAVFLFNITQDGKQVKQWSKHHYKKNIYE